MEDFVAGLERTLAAASGAGQGRASGEQQAFKFGQRVHIQRENRRQRPPALQKSIAASAASTAYFPAPPSGRTAQPHGLRRIAISHSKPARSCSRSTLTHSTTNSH